jgi:hypothetical protein
MNLDKLLASLSDLWARHAPTVLMHGALFIVMQTWVANFGPNLGAEHLWHEVKTKVDALLVESGIKIERGYALAAIGYVYLVIVQWLADTVTQFPGLRPTFAYRTFDVDFLRHAGNVLRLPPDPYRILEKVDQLVDKFTRGFKERGEPEPYSWLQADISKWSRFYGLAIVATVASLVWWLEGGSGAVSRSRVGQLALCLLGFALLARGQLTRKYRNRRRQLRYAALRSRELEDSGEAEANQLSHLRNDAIVANVAYEKAYQRHPTTLVRRYTARLPGPVRETLWHRLSYLPRPAEDWELTRSQAARQEDYTGPLPSSLSVSAYQARFRNLLECRGSGLFFLVNRDLGLAPSAEGGGAEYSFETRRHGYGEVMIRFRADWRKNEDGWLSTNNYGALWGFLADIGPYPIERVAGGNLPEVDDPQLAWWHLLESELDMSGIAAANLDTDNAKVHGIAVRSALRARPGNTYLLRSRCRSGAEAVIAFQCFATPDVGRLLIAWKFLNVFREKQQAPQILPWWKPAAWLMLEPRRPP